MRPWIPSIVAILAILSLGFTGLSARAEAPVIPGLHHPNQPLDENQVGEVLIGELRCATCHASEKYRNQTTAPNLSGAGSRLTPDFLRRFLADPHAVQPGTTMPDLFGSTPEKKRRELAESIAAWLGSLAEESPNEVISNEASADEGAELFHSVGCVACHPPRAAEGNELASEGRHSLAHLPGKYRAGALAEFLHQPLQVRSSGRMPEMKLTREEAASLEAYLAGAPGKPGETVASGSDLVEAGRQAFVQHNCHACHDTGTPGLPDPREASPLAELDLARGCLSDDPGGFDAPDFHLDASQKQSIRRALETSGDKPPSPEQQIELTLTRLNCIACHVRDDFGGVTQDLDAYFHSTEESLGNEARIPPPLTLAGAKLRTEWMNRVLFDGETVRPYMTTRMPQFGREALAGLPEWLAKVDHLEPVEFPEPDRESEPMIRNGGHLLVGDKGLNCIACHNFNGKESPALKGLDLMTSYQRLQPAWFSRFLRNPAELRPGIIMPSFWPGGEAVNTDILDGDADRQLAALWHFFSLGRSARDPSGLRSQPSILEVTEQARTYRGRSEVAGYRGIAVGFPGGLNYAFDAQNGTLAALWKGGFVNVGWQGQGPGNFRPEGKPLLLSRDVAFLADYDQQTPWPRKPETSKEQPVNPDPLYPRNHGYAFLGYSLDAESSIPTFRYRCHDIEIEDRITTTRDNGKDRFRRTLRFSAPEARALWFRPLVGRIETKTETVITTTDLRLAIEPTNVAFRLSRSDETELLIEIPLEKGETVFTLDYELLR